MSSIKIIGAVKAYNNGSKYKYRKHGNACIIQTSHVPSIAVG